MHLICSFHYVVAVLSRKVFTHLETCILLLLLENLPVAQERNPAVAALTLSFPLGQALYFRGCRPVHYRAEPGYQVVFLKVRTSPSQTALGFRQKLWLSLLGTHTYSCMSQNSVFSSLPVFYPILARFCFCSVVPGLGMLVWACYSFV